MTSKDHRRHKKSHKKKRNKERFQKLLSREQILFVNEEEWDVRPINVDELKPVEETDNEETVIVDAEKKETRSYCIIS